MVAGEHDSYSRRVVDGCDKSLAPRLGRVKVAGSTLLWAPVPEYELQVNVVVRLSTSFSIQFLIQVDRLRDPPWQYVRVWSTFSREATARIREAARDREHFPFKEEGQGFKSPTGYTTALGE